MNDADEIRDALLEGLDSVVVTDACGALLVLGEDACVVLAAEVDERPEALIAAARWGEGRVVAFGHSALLEVSEDDADEKKRLVSNALAWASGKKRGARVLVHQSSDLAQWLSAQGHDVFDADRAYATVRREAGARDVLVTAEAPLGPKDREAIEAFVTAGGGLLIAATGWAHPHYGAKERGRVVPLGNSALLGPTVGILWDEGVSLPGNGDDDASIEPDGDLADRAHAGHDVDRVIAWLNGAEPPPADDLDDEETDALLARSTRNAVRTMRLGAQYALDWSALSDAIDQSFHSQERDIAPSPENPLEQSERWRRALLFLQTERWRWLPADEVPACDAANEYPGAVADDAESEDATLTVDTAVAQWHSTGRYARPGTVIEIEASEEALERGLRVRIGAHIDELYTEADQRTGVQQDAGYASDEGDWKRWPELSFEYPLTDHVTRVASPFGGLVYVIVPDDGEGEHEITVRGCVRAPSFVLDRDSVFAWRSSVRDAPAPWGELACGRLIFTFPSEHLRSIEDPEALMRFWDRAMQRYEELAGVPYRRPERIVADRQPSLGYLHSGYPIVGLLDDEDSALTTVLDTRKVVTDGAWGPLHELGHNVQQDAWTFEGADEVTNNVFVLFVMEALCGIAPMQNPALKDSIAKVAAYQRDGANFDVWKEDPFLALVMYAQLQQGFGWRPFIDVFAEYRDLPEDQRPQSDDDKRDQWMVRLSKRVGHDLGPFFEAWGVPTSAKARAKVKALPKWDPPPTAGRGAKKRR
jgi:hypothetical protein